MTQARSRRKSKIIKQIERRELKGENRLAVADEILHDFVTGRDNVLNQAQCEAVARDVRAHLGL